MTTIHNDENRLIKRNISIPSSSISEDKEPTVSPSPPVTPSSSTLPTAYDWESDKRRSKPSDDGTMSFFWHTHTITCLVIAMSYLFYVALLEQPSEDSSYNTKR
jgi:hypothetical protein